MIVNGTFDTDLNGWTLTTSEIADIIWDNGRARLRIFLCASSQLEQTFTIDNSYLLFDWTTDADFWWAEIFPGIIGWKLIVDDTTIIDEGLPVWSGGTRLFDVSQYIGKLATIVFYIRPTDSYLTDSRYGCNSWRGTYNVYLWVDNVKISTAGYLNIGSDPVGAKIIIDGIDTAEVTPSVIQIPPGYHTYSLSLTGYTTYSETIFIESGETIDIFRCLTPEGSVHFESTPSGAKIIIDGIDTTKVTPDTINNISLGYHNFSLSLDGYYDITGKFRSISNITKQITEELTKKPLEQTIVNGNFDTDLAEWQTYTPNASNGNVIWDNGTAYMYGHDIYENAPLHLWQDFVIKEDVLLFDFWITDTLRHCYDARCYIIIDPDIPDARTVFYWEACQGGGPRFEVDISAYKGKTARLLFTLAAHLRYSYTSSTRVDNVANVPKIDRTITFNTYCTKPADCIQTIERCYADIYLDGNLIGENPITITGLTLARHNYLIRNKGYISTDTNSEDITGFDDFSPGEYKHVYIDGIYTPGPKAPGEGCVYIESDPAGTNIFIDGINTGKVTPDTICNLSLGNHIYELKLLNHTVYKGSFSLSPQFGEYISVTITGSIYFTSIPSRARIELDGQNLGVYTPYLLKGIKTGNHTFVLRLPNYDDYINTIYVIGEPT